VSGADLRARLLAQPDDVEAHLVYADWLQAQGHPQGELIMLHHAHLGRSHSRELDVAAGRILNRHWRELLGELGDPGGVERRWHLGFIRAARIYDDGEPTTVARLIETLVGLDTALLLRELTVERSDRQGSMAAAIAALKQFPPRILQRLSLGNRRLGTIGDLRGLDEKLPHVRELELNGPIDDAMIASFQELRWPLEELLLVPGRSYHLGHAGDDDEDSPLTQQLLELLAAPGLAGLERLRLDGYDESMLQAVRKAFPRLRLLPRPRP
jgi:uncharacterized protein (TIGR02996 family)